MIPGNMMTATEKTLIHGKPGSGDKTVLLSSLDWSCDSRMETISGPENSDLCSHQHCETIPLITESGYSEEKNMLKY